MKYLIIEGKGEDTDIPYVEEWEYTPDRQFHNRVYKINYDSDSAETAFWRNINTTLLSGEFIIKPVKGWGNIDYYGTHLAKRRDTEEIVICYDFYVFQKDHPAIEEKLKAVKRACEENKVRLKIIYYYTFEWAILSVINFVKWCMPDSNPEYQILSQLQDAVINLEDPQMWQSDDEVYYAIRSLGLKLSKHDSFERAATAILRRITKGSVFIVDKGRFGIGWVSSCFAPNQCEHCKLQCGLRERNMKMSLDTKYITITNDSKVLSRTIDIIKLLPSKEQDK